MSMLGLRDLVLIAPTPSSLHHHHLQGQPISSDHTNNNNSSNLSVGFGIFPLLTATPCVPQHHHTTNNNNNNDVQDHCGGTTTTNTTNTNTNNNYWNLKMCPEVMLMNPASARKQGEVVEEDDNDDDDDDEGHNNRAVNAVMMESEEDEHGGDGGGGELRVCQDCGNRAKKECLYRRCRTCCKGRGYDCNTHVRSTWVPAIRRRERHMAVPVPATAANKRQRALGLSHNNVTPTSHSSNSNATTPKSFDSTSSHQDAGFKQSLPGHVRAPAVFRCHRVSSIGNSENEFAYLATVHISGHVFKGFLYDHGVGVEGKINAMPCAASELQLGNNSSRGKNKECSYPIGVPTNNAYSASAT